MKSIKDTPYINSVKEIRTYEFGTFFFFDHLVVSEINEGVVFNWEMAKKVINAAFDILGNQFPIAYISNRIHSYSLVPTDWLKFYKEYKNHLTSYSIVVYRYSTITNIFLEKMFSDIKIQKFNTIDNAINWSISEKQKLIINELFNLDSKIQIEDSKIN